MTIKRAHGNFDDIPCAVEDNSRAVFNELIQPADGDYGPPLPKQPRLSANAHDVTHLHTLVEDDVQKVFQRIFLSKGYFVGCALADFKSFCGNFAGYSDILPRIFFEVLNCAPVLDPRKVEDVLRKALSLTKRLFARLRIDRYPNLDSTDSAWYRPWWKLPIISILNDSSNFAEDLKKFNDGLRDCAEYLLVLEKQQWSPPCEVSSISYYLSKLSSLEIPEFQISPKQLQNLALFCPQLLSVNFRDCFQTWDSRKSTSKFFKRCRRLQCVNVSGRNNRITAWSLMPLFPKTLLKLTIEINMTYKQTQCIPYKPRSIRCQKLEELRVIFLFLDHSVEDCEIPGGIEGAKDFLSSFQKLQHLELAFHECQGPNPGIPPPCSKLTQFAFPPLPRLEQLSMTNFRIDHLLIASLTEDCKMLRELKICSSFIFDEDDSLYRLDSLTSLTLRDVLIITESGTHGSASSQEGNGILTKIAVQGRLKYLELDRVYTSKINEAVSAAFRHCKGLMHVKLCQLGELTENSFLTMTQLLDERLKTKNEPAKLELLIWSCPKVNLAAMPTHSLLNVHFLTSSDYRYRNSARTQNLYPDMDDASGIVYEPPHWKQTPYCLLGKHVTSGKIEQNFRTAADIGKLPAHIRGEDEVLARLAKRTVNEMGRYYHSKFSFPSSPRIFTGQPGSSSTIDQTLCNNGYDFLLPTESPHEGVVGLPIRHSAVEHFLPQEFNGLDAAESDEETIPLSRIKFQFYCKRMISLDVPAEILDKIFSYLPLTSLIKMERVCKLWQALALRSWKRGVRVVSFETLYGTCKPEKPRVIVFRGQQLRAVLTRCSNLKVRELRLDAFRSTIPCLDIFWEFLLFFRCLTVLDLSDIYISRKLMPMLGSCVELLTEAGFHNCLRDDVSHVGPLSFCVNCRNLQSIDTAGSRVPSSVLWVWKWINPKMVSLNAGEVTISMNDLIRHETPEVARTLIELFGDANDLSNVRPCTKKWTNLRRLMISFSELEYSSDMPGIKEMLETLTELRELRLNVHFWLDTTPQLNQLLHVNIGALSKLTALTLTGAHLTDQTMESLGRGCVNLKCLDLSGCFSVVSKEGLRWLSYLPRLTVLDLSETPVNDEVLHAISQKGFLQALLLRHSEGITDTGVASVLRFCQRLVCLDVSDCKKISFLSLDSMRSFVRARREVSDLMDSSADMDALKNCIFANIPRSKMSTRARLAADEDWRLTPFEDFCNRLGPQKTLELHVWINESGIPLGTVSEGLGLLVLHSGEDDSSPFLRLSQENFRLKSPTFTDCF